MKTLLKKTLILAACLVIVLELAILAMRHFPGYRLRANVVIILLDTVRADRLGCYGNPDGLTPNIDRFAQGATRFDNCFSHAPWTLPSVASLYTSRYPIQHGAGGNINSFTLLPESALTIAEVFKNAGAATCAVVNVSFLTQTFGMHQGFDTMDIGLEKGNEECRTADETTDAALDWLSRHSSKRFFLLVHYFDPHLVYDPPTEYRRRFADPRDRETTDTLFGSRPQMLAFRSGDLVLEESLVRRLEKLHNAEIAFVDAQVGRLLESLSSMRASEKTVVLITSDHGEEFWDHSGFEHGHTLYNELLHVPMILHVPEKVDLNFAERSGSTMTSPIRHVDLAPALCQLAGAEIPSSFVGVPIDPESFETGTGLPVFSQGNMWGAAGLSFQHKHYKIIREASPEMTLLFNLESDPAESVDRSQTDSEQSKQMDSYLDDFLQMLQQESTEHKAARLTEAERDRLRSLGYMK